MHTIDIPIDIHESATEVVVVMPLGGVVKDSVKVILEDHDEMIIRGERVAPAFKPTLVPQKEQCYRGQFQRSVKLPKGIYRYQIQSELTPDNILIITLPKVIEVETIPVTIK